MSLTVDGQASRAEGSLLDAVLAAGIDLPHLCRDDNLPAIGACRTCLVEADGRIVAACSLPAEGFSSVDTQSERARRIRRTVLELTAGMQEAGSEGKAGGPLAAAAHLAYACEGVDVARFATATGSQIDVSSPFFAFHEDQCILCGRCIVACQALQHIGAIGLARKGEATRVTPGAGVPFNDSTCTACGSCVAACPTTALRPKEGPTDG